MKTFNLFQEAREYATENPTELIEYKSFNKDGNIEAQLFFLNGELHKDCTWFYEMGNVKELIFYKNGKRHGEYKWFNKDGTLIEDCFYENDNLHGEYKWYYYDGTLSEHGFYKNGEEQPQLDYLKTERDEITLTLLFGENYI